jgi:hypothetical protein
MLGYELLFQFLCFWGSIDGVNESRLREAGTESIDVNTVGSAVPSGGFGKAYDCVFGSYVAGCGGKVSILVLLVRARR